MKKWPVIRHIRWLLLRREYAKFWKAVSIDYATPSPRDLEYLDRVWKGLV